MFALGLLRGCALLLASFAAGIVGSLGAQENGVSPSNPAPPDAQSDYVFKSTVRRVVLDVVVSDSLGRPVSDLTADDFSVVEDGKPQRVRDFDVHDFESVSDSLPTLPSSMPTNTFVNVPAGPERGPLYVLLLDLLNMEVSDQPVARKQLLDFVRNKPLGTRFAIYVLSDHLFQVQGFTEDRNRLADAVDPKNPHCRIPKIFLYADNYRPFISTPGVLARIGEYLADLPGHKNLIWFSGAFPSAIMPDGKGETEALSISDQIREATDNLTRGRVAVYPVDVRGVVVTSPGASGGAPAGNGDGLAADAMLNANHMTEEEIAFATGGRAFHDNNDLASALSAATETGGHYYTLTYSPSNENYDGKLRHIRVQLSKRGYRLEYRRAYYGNPDSSGKEPAKELRSAADLAPIVVSKPSDSLYPNMQHGAPIAHQLLFRAYIHTLAPAAKATREQMAKLVDKPAAQKRGNDSAEKHRRPLQLQTYQIDYTIAARYPLLEIAAAAYDDDGKILNSAIERYIEPGTDFPDSKSGGALYRVQQKFDVPLNAASVRVAVRDVATDNVGALEIKLPLVQDERNASTSTESSFDALEPTKER